MSNAKCKYCLDTGIIIPKKWTEMSISELVELDNAEHCLGCDDDRCFAPVNLDKYNQCLHDRMSVLSENQLT